MSRGRLYINFEGGPDLNGSMICAATMCSDGSTTNLATCTAIGGLLGTGCHLTGFGISSTCVARESLFQIRNLLPFLCRGIYSDTGAAIKPPRQSWQAVAAVNA